MDELRVPKNRTPVELWLIGGAKRNVLVFLTEYAAGHTGAERMSDLLNADTEFLPAVDTSTDKVILISRASIAVAWVSTHIEDGDAEQHTIPTEHEVQVTLAGGESLQGLISYVMPPDRSRLNDYLNDQLRFIKLIAPDRIGFIHKRSITLVEQLGSSTK